MSTTRPESAALVFVIAPLHRSGSTYLHDLLALHPDLESHAVNEDYLLASAHHLEVFTATVRENWARRPRNRDTLDTVVEQLLPALGSAVSRVLHDTGAGTGTGKRILLKTPVISNLHLLPALFNDARTVVIVRDGREVVASGMESFGWKLESAAQRWAQNVRTLLAQRDEQSQDLLVVRYEDLIDPGRDRICLILEHLDLDPNRFPFEAITELPVRGSTEGGRKDGRLNWAGVERGPDFRPARRSAGWSRARQARFQWLAGDELKLLGYPRQIVLSAPERWVNRALDLAKIASRPVRRRLGRSLTRKPS